MNKRRGLAQGVLFVGMLLGPGLGARLEAAVHATKKVPGTAGERRAAEAMEKARGSALALHAFLERMPKGADLHMHLSGAVYAETFVREAAADLMCVNPATLSLVANVGTSRSIPPQAVCGEHAVAATQALKDQKLYDDLIDAFSMRSFVPSAGVSGHDQFFATFGRFGGLKDHSGDWLDEVATRAAAQNEQYLEVMMTPSFGMARKIAEEVGWPEQTTDALGNGKELDAARLAGLREAMLGKGLRDEVGVDRKEIDDALARREQLEHCGQADAAPGCSVTIRVIYQVLRANRPEQVYAQTVLGFEVAAADRNVVGINYVQPEDAYLAMTEYRRQMGMLDYLHGVYPGVHISLHAGELAPGLVPPEGLRFHIREAVERGHAERIGHGVDVMYEDRPEELLKEMAARHVMVEINLTSNDVILGVTANEHSLPVYRSGGVPVALSTDDEGVSRINMTREFVRAARDFGLSYVELKTMVRTGLEHSFLPGASLWAAADDFRVPVRECGVAGAGTPSVGCAEFLRGSERAAQQWELERRFSAFEAGFAAGAGAVH